MEPGRFSRRDRRRPADNDRVRRFLSSAAEIAPDDLIAQALEHCVFPLAAAEVVQRDGPKIYVRGEGVRVTDVGGREYLDMMSSHTRANSLGYGNAEVAAAVGKQL